MKRFLIALLLVPSLAWAAGFSTERWGSSLRGPGFAPMQRGGIATFTVADPFDRSGIYIEWDFSKYVDPGVGLIASSVDSSGNNITAVCALETAKPALVGEHIVIAANDGLLATFPSAVGTWTVYIVSDPSATAGDKVVFYHGSPCGPALYLIGGNVSYGSGYGNSTPYFEWGRWTYGGTDLPKAVYAWTSDGKGAKHYYNGVLDGEVGGSLAGQMALRPISTGVFCYLAPGGNYACLGSHWYMSIFSGEHSASRVASTSAALWTLYGGRS